MYTPTPARPMLRSSGLGGVESSAPGISCATGSSQTVENTCSTTSSCVFGPAAARKCFNMVRQRSSGQSCSTCETRKTETFSCRAGCGVKKSWPWKPKRQFADTGMVTVEVEFNVPWNVTRPDSTASGRFTFQCYVANYFVGNPSHFGRPRELDCTYIYCLLNDWFTVLNDETKVRVIPGKCQGLRPNSTSNIDN